ncbi:tetratricopeptide repeat protein, partial [Acinetobacter baumannii]
MDKLAKCLIKQEKYDEAEAIYLKASNFWKNEGSNNGADARCAYALGALYTDQKKYSQAAPVLERALQMAKQNSGVDSVTI